MSEEQEVKLKPIKHVTVTYESGWRYIFAFAVIVMWLVGIVVAKGDLATTISVIIPPYALYLAVEHVMQLMGVV